MDNAMLLSYRDMPGGTAPLPNPVANPLKFLTSMARLPNLPWLHFLLQVPVTLLPCLGRLSSIVDFASLLPGPTAKGDMLPQRQWFKALGLLSSASHFKARLDEGSTKLKVLDFGFNGSEAGTGLEDLFIDRPIMGDICPCSPLLGMREGASVGMEGGGGSHEKGLVPGWQGLNCEGSVGVWLCVNDADGRG